MFIKEEKAMYKSDTERLKQVKARIRRLRLSSVLAFALLTLLLTAQTALAAGLYPTEIRETGEGGKHRLEKVYILSAADNPDNIPTEEFEREGYHYTLMDIVRQDYSESDAKEYSETVTINSKTKDMVSIMPQLAATKEVETEDGYAGTLTLDTASIKVEAAGYSSSSRTVTANRTYPNLSDADTSYIPKSVSENGRTLKLADIQWQESGNGYTANATYTGSATSKSATGYTVTANYVGQVAKTVSGEIIYTAVFSGTPVASGGAAMMAEGGNFAWLLALLLAAVIGGAFFGGRMIIRKRKAKKEWREYTK